VAERTRIPNWDAWLLCQLTCARLSKIRSSSRRSNLRLVSQGTGLTATAVSDDIRQCVRLRYDALDIALNHADRCSYCHGPAYCKVSSIKVHRLIQFELSLIRKCCDSGWVHILTPNGLYKRHWSSYSL
jgi:hypothetical protein